MNDIADLIGVDFIPIVSSAPASACGDRWLIKVESASASINGVLNCCIGVNPGVRIRKLRQVISRTRRIFVAVHLYRKWLSPLVRSEIVGCSAIMPYFV